MTPEARETVRRALAEDLGPGDITSECFIPANHDSLARIIAKEPLVLAGSEVAREVFLLIDERIVVTTGAADGSSVSPGEPVLTARGPTRALLAAERTALNFLQRLSGIATLTRQFVDAVAGTKAVILDTRKTTPGLREFERLAVRAGGGTNHRFGLFDRVLAKDNHLAVTGDADAIQRAIREAHGRQPGILIEIEADTLDQVRMLCGLRGVDIILLDNMTNDQLREAVRIRGGKKILLEASGGVNLQTVRGIAETGVDHISVGSLTHSARAVDLSMEIDPESPR
ncbi:MAG: carboxylating nicotinate-nucleotide diphosphorylase [Chthoniobacterales bacterium]|nr:carboxylating nicotinate-nucleotide diphosphorylase [Chthoniobacterales bacterium]